MPHLDIGGFLMSFLSPRKWGYLMEYDTDAKRMERLRVLLSERVFTEMIDSIYPLADASEAFVGQLRRGKQGKLLIQLSEPCQLMSNNLTDS
jgi:hypothetical protein